MEATLTIGRVHAEYLVDRNVPNLAEVRDRCDEAMGAQLKGALAATLGRWCDHNDASIWVVRCVDIAVAANAILPSEALSHEVARAVATNLRDVLVGDGDGVEAIRFPDAAALLSRFLIDSANGDAWSRWYYGRYRGLGLLTASATLRTAICEDPGLGLTALQRMSGDELAAVANAMSPADAMAARINLGSASDEHEFGQCFSACLSTWRDVAAHRLSSAAHALALFVYASRLGAGGRQLNAAIDAVQEFERSFDSDNNGRDWDTNHSMGAQFLAQLDSAARDRLITVLKPTAASPIQRASLGTYATDFGGSFLLFPLLEALLDDLMIAPKCSNDGDSLAQLRLLIISACTGVDNASRAFEDPVLRFVCGAEASAGGGGHVDALTGLLKRSDLLNRRIAVSLRRLLVIRGRASDMSAVDQKYFQSSIDGHGRAGWVRLINSLAYEVLKRFAERLPGFADSTCAYLWKNFLNVGAQVDLESERVIVRLARAPLHLVTNLSGMTSASYRLPFGDARHYVLFSGE